LKPKNWEQCEVPCLITWNQSEIASSDGVIFFYHPVGEEKRLLFEQLPPKSSTQKYILLNMEAAYEKRRIRFSRS
jgi:hypothetical protein